MGSVAVWPRRGVPLLLAGSLLLGVAHAALLPPWEGFDERAHYSYLQQIADLHERPRRPEARYSVDVEAYARVAPLRYQTRPPMEQTGALTYKTFFEASPETIARGRAEVHGLPASAREFRPGSRPNLQAQHPPLYYMLLAPLYRSTRDWSLGAQLLVLRLGSYFLAWLAIAVGVAGCWAALRASRGTAEDGPLWSWAMGAIAAWPALLPAWFPEMARLGADSFCALLVALVWSVSVGAWRGGLTLAHGAALGVLLGLGGLTKAFFVPISVGVLAFWLAEAWRRGGWPGVRRAAGPLALAAALGVILAGWWYYDNWARHGVALGSDELIALRQRGGLAARLPGQFSIPAWIRGHAAVVATFAWSGTWSFARPPHILFVPLVLMVLLTALGYLAALPRLRRASLGRLPLWMVGPVLAGLSYHVLVRVALVGEGRGTSGYYLHLFVVPLGVAFGIAAGVWSASAGVRALLGTLAIYAVTFAVAVSWAQVLLFAGILYKAGASEFYQFPDALPPLLGVPLALARLEVLAFPKVGAAAWVIGGALALAGLVCLWREARTLPPLRDQG